eukprot:3385587-Pyramimonas_sp.AAC.1
MNVASSALRGGPLGGVSVVSWAFLGHLGANSGSWLHLGQSGRHLVAILGSLGAILALLRPF